eukprot:scaffold2707_cov417-Prasinococcus_capsulatus_cf.AAC.26
MFAIRRLHARCIWLYSLDNLLVSQVQLVVAAGSSIYPANVRVPPGGSAVLCDGLGSGANHVIEGQTGTATAMTSSFNTHPATASEVPGWDQTAMVNNGEEWPPMIINADFEGTVPSRTINMFPEGTIPHEARKYEPVHSQNWVAGDRRLR